MARAAGASIRLYVRGLKRIPVAAQTVSAPAGSGISQTTMRVQPLGNAPTPAGDVFASLRLNGDDGSFDTGFGQDGVAAHDHPDTPDQSANFTSSVDIASSDRVVLGGCADDGTGERVFALMRLREDGAQDANAPQLPANTASSWPFPTRHRPTPTARCPSTGAPPLTVAVDLDIREIDTGNVWTLSWSDIQPTTYAPPPLPDEPA